MLKQRKLISTTEKQAVRRFQKQNQNSPPRKSCVETCLVQVAKNYNYANVRSQESLVTFKDEKAEPISNYTCCGITYITNKEKARDWMDPWTPHMVHFSKALLGVQQNVVLLSRHNSVVWKAAWFSKLLKWTISTDVLCQWWWSPAQLSSQIKLGNYCSSCSCSTLLKEIQCFTCRTFCDIRRILLWVTYFTIISQKKLCNLNQHQ